MPLAWAIGKSISGDETWVGVRVWARARIRITVGVRVRTRVRVRARAGVRVGAVLSSQEALAL